MKGPKDPVDHVRTSRTHAGESMTDNRTVPALAVLGVTLVVFVACLAAFGTGNYGVGVVLAVVAGAGFVIGGAWLLIAHLRVRRIEDRWYDEHPEVHRQHPTS